MQKAWLVLLSTCFVFVSAGYSQKLGEASSGKISGRVVVLPTQEPASAKVSSYLIKDPPGSINVIFVKLVQTDSRGNYSLDSLSPGTYLVRATMPGFISASAWGIYVAPGHTRIVDLGLQVTGGDFAPGSLPPLDIIGTVESASKEIIVDATVTAVNMYDFSQVYQVRTDSMGKYNLRPFHEGRYMVYALKPGYHVGDPISIKVPTERRWDLVLTPERN